VKFRGKIDLPRKKCTENLPQGDPFFPSVDPASGKPFCLAFTRSMPGQLTLGFREQINQVFLHLPPQIYTETLPFKLRTMHRINAEIRKTLHSNPGCKASPVTYARELQRQACKNLQHNK
jgi:hypothetical protein